MKFFNQSRYKRRHPLLTLLLVGTTLAVFWPVCGHEFVLWDDQINVYENPYLSPVTPSNVLHFWKESYENLYIPVTYTLWAGIAYLAQHTTAGHDEPKLYPHLFHSTNLVLHLLSVLVVFAILRMLFSNDWAACCGAMLFALHPVQVEPVAWITGMKDVLCGLLSLVAVLQYMRYVQLSSEGHVQTAKRYYMFSTAAFVLALLAKPTAVVVPVLAWVLVNFGLGHKYSPASLPNVNRTLMIWVLTAIPFVLLTKSSQGTAVNFVTPLWARPLVAGDAITFYLYKLLVPVYLGIDYGRSPESVLYHGWTLLTGFIAYGLLASLWLLRNQIKSLFAAAAVFVLSLLPTLGLIPFGFQHYSTVADRYLYLSMLGPALALCWLISSYTERTRGKMIFFLCVLVLGMLGIRSTFQIQHWSSDVELFTHALAVNPASGGSHNNLGLALARRGFKEKAMTHYREAIRFTPENANAHNNLGIALADEGKIEDAINYFKEALRIKPDFVDVHCNLGIALSKVGKTPEAVAHFREALRIRPNDVEAHNNLGVTLVKEGKITEAVAHFREALRIRPKDAKTRDNLGIALTIQRKSP